MPRTRKPRELNNKEIWACDPEAVEAALDAITTADDMDRAGRLFHCLANGNRLRALVVLARTELCIVDLAGVLNMTPAGATTIVDAFRDLNLVDWRSESGLRFYSLRNPDLVKEAVRLVAETVWLGKKKAKRQAKTQ